MKTKPNTSMKIKKKLLKWKHHTLEDGENRDPKIPEEEEEEGWDWLDPKSSEVKEEEEFTCFFPSIFPCIKNLWLNTWNKGRFLCKDNPTNKHQSPLKEHNLKIKKTQLRFFVGNKQNRQQREGRKTEENKTRKGRDTWKGCS